ncbi:aldose 1-epimerase [Mesocricetibacter intestinalis]|uniref:Aldose 1-epimerase n=1 Tax=Mesocricetibacter intestinalis TaxID=1521930 RepID=A0A4R6VBP5_9PAST|nr:galactose-1-epimerase [Mesocricetibacter intestinalis]TDQ57939.1 aldose 1-epimerase [Mesocricetibacter intestinalis]
MLMETSSIIAPDGLPYQIFTLCNANGMRISITDWGATWISCQVPVKQELREVLLGCGLQDYPRQQAFMGATIGRYANRIAGAEFSLNGKKVRLSANEGHNQLHGGKGYDKRRWTLHKSGQNFVEFFLSSPDGEEGFSGKVEISARYLLSEDNRVEISYQAVSDQDTPLNLTNHAYFNLDDAEHGSDVRNHFLYLNADYFLPVNVEGIPDAPLTPVANSSFDFRAEKTLQRDFLSEPRQIAVGGYDHAFLLNERGAGTEAARLLSSDRSLAMQVFTSQAAIQVYSGNFLAGTPMRNGTAYSNYAGIALETQALPDTPNHPEWQRYGGISKAGETYRHYTFFQFI